MRRNGAHHEMAQSPEILLFWALALPVERVRVPLGMPRGGRELCAFAFGRRLDGDAVLLQGGLSA
jgi:hypothetical protein